MHGVAASHSLAACGSLTYRCVNQVCEEKIAADRVEVSAGRKPSSFAEAVVTFLKVRFGTDALLKNRLHR